MMRRITIVFLYSALVLCASHSRAHAALILNEALANEPGATTTLEWVEILNWPDTGQAISLAVYKYIDGGQTVLLDTNIFIQAGGYAVLARKATGASSFEERWGNASGVWGDHASESYPIVAVSQMSLRNSSDTIRLVSPMGDTSMILWQSDSGDGVSIERIRPGPNDAPANFATCRAPSGSTPGTENSVFPPRGELALDTVVVGPANPVSGQPVQFAVRIINLGFGEVAGGTVELLRTGQLPQPINSANFDAIPEGGETTVVMTWADPRPGVTDLLIRVSSDADTSNNSYSLQLTSRFDKPYMIISEYLANPDPGGPEEWIEVANVSATTINLLQLRVGDSLNTELIPAAAGEVPAGEFILLVENQAAFRAFYPAFAGSVIQVPGWRALNNTGDGIRLIGPSGEIIDSLSFRTTYPDNHSAERVELSVKFAAQGDWAECEDDAGATPGRPNSVMRGDPGSLILDSVWLAPSAPAWGDTIRIFAAVSNSSFGPASGWSILASRDLDFSAPGASLSEIGESVIPATGEDESAVIEVIWSSAAPGIHRVHVALRDESGATISTSANVTTVLFSKPLIIISEYMAAPSSSGPGEWIELYNPSGITLSLQGVRIGDSAGLSTIPPPSLEMAPGTFLVIAQDENRFRGHFTNFNGQVRSLGNWFILNDSGDRLRVIGSGDEIIDSISFTGLQTQNRSIERRELIADFADPRDWGESIDFWGATPGMPNSIRRYAVDVSIDSVVLETDRVVWPGPVRGTAYISNLGFGPANDVFVSVIVTGLGEVHRLTHASTIASGERVEIPFEIQTPRIGLNSFDYLLDEDDFGNNNYASDQIWAASPFPSVIVTEYLSDPDALGPGEWIEIYNASTVEVAMAGFSVGDSSSLSPIPATLVDYLAPGDFLVLCADRQRFVGFYPAFDGELRQLTVWRELNNSGDKIRIRGAAGEIVDSLSYASGHGDNVSSERLAFSSTFSVPSEWTRCVDPSGATPGRYNSVNAASAGTLQVDVSPNPVFRSAGQQARIDYRLEIGESLTLKIYDRAGRLVRTIVDDTPSATGFVDWNGTDDDGYNLRPGPYVLFARSEPAGSMKKMVVVIAP